MRPITTRTIACVVAVVVGAAPLTAASPAANGDTPCTPPKSFATNWQGATADGVTFQVPKGFHLAGHTFTSGRRSISAALNMRSPVILTQGAFTAVSQCRAVIANRPVLITTYRGTYEDEAMAPSGL
ncbi:MAG: hypothetical protein IRY91_12100, partial [Gemmatimonadaceae bacterium]|nr:hypothetical protein [Gemmatimonadaceae bacterium]